jgi:transposase, IS6 family
MRTARPPPHIETVRKRHPPVGTPEGTSNRHQRYTSLQVFVQSMILAIDQFDQIIDVFVSPRRDVRAARRFFEQAIGTTKSRPIEVVTDQASTYPIVLNELLPTAWHRTDRYANNRVEADHGRLKARLRPMRGLKQDRSARVIIAGHAFVQNLRRGHYELAVEQPTNRRVAVAFDQLVLAI